MSLRPVHVSGSIYVANISTAIAAGLLALKMFRSTAYSDDVMELKKNGNGHAKDTPPPSPNVQP